jgi:16S rRNA (guanine(1405)-N(7))-methyltransferase
LQQAASDHKTAQKLRRTSAFKKAASAAKKKIYYHLRNYRSDTLQLEHLIDELEQATPDTPIEKQNEIIASIINGHASTRERLVSQHEFYRRLSELVEPPRNILDIGCGVHPLMFPFDAEFSKRIDRYIAADKNGKDIACIRQFSRLQQNKNLVGVQWDISDGWSALANETGCHQYDFAFIMKVVPVVGRQARELLTVLSETPAPRWLLTGSRVAMAKRRSIERRERRALEEFVTLAGRTVKHEFVVDEEFAWIVEAVSSTG